MFIWACPGGICAVVHLKVIQLQRLTLFIISAISVISACFVEAGNLNAQLLVPAQYQLLLLF